MGKVIKMVFDTKGAIVDAIEQSAQANHAQFYAILKQLPGNPTKEELVYEASYGQTTSLTEMYREMPDVYEAMIEQMQKIATPELSYTYTKRYMKHKADVPDEVRKKRSELLKACNEYGIRDNNDGLFWRDINRFLENPKIGGKPLYDMTDTDEIQAVIKRIKTICYNRDKEHDYSAKWKDKIE